MQLIIADFFLLLLSVWLSFWFRLAQPYNHGFTESLVWILCSVCVSGIPIYALTGQYRDLTRYMDSRYIYQLSVRNGILVMFLVMLAIFMNLPMPPRSTWLLLWLLSTVLIGSSRFVFRDFLRNRKIDSRIRTTKVAIYGAGIAGVQLANALRFTGSHIVKLFLDDSPDLWDRNINGVSIKPPQILSRKDLDIDQILLAIPSLTRCRRRSIVEELQSYGISVLQVPSVDEITSGRTPIDSLRPIAIEELLGRDEVLPDSNFLGPGITGMSVCVTGAGGSIGSELCRQILRMRPQKLILFELSEPSLYTIHQELRESFSDEVILIPVLGSAANYSLLDKCFIENSVDIVFHAAAYKHVPLVESNPLAGLENNVVSTLVVCDACRRNSVKKMILISTDKAVRPTNVMGASKRLAELVVQAQPNCSTLFAMVRFGNVLGSSGSVVPLFRDQISKGGPITLTHPEVIRYFMTIPEAALLVLQAGVLARNGDVLLLDMGDPVRIKSLAEQMIKLSGLSIKNDSNPNGDIEIICIGLRPGEKLYEELLIDGQSEKTAHPLIFRAQEKMVPGNELFPQINHLQDLISIQDTQKALLLLSKLVPEWTF